MVPHHVTALVLRVLETATREWPADAVLRDLLRAEPGLGPIDRRQVSRTVFAYYRWLGWLSRKFPLKSRVERALELDERFRRNPFSLAEAELRAKTIPAWVAENLAAPVEWFRSLQREPRLWLRSRPDGAGPLAAELGDCHACSLPGFTTSLEYRGSADLHHTAAFRRGAFEIQDLSSQAVGWLCRPAPGETWWDVCAGEGGKTLHLSDLMGNKGLVWATDRAEWRLATLRRRAARAGCFNVRWRVWSGGERPPARGACHGVLVDAPCSGVGTWQRNPHARWILREADVQELGQKQAMLLAAAAPAVRPGGRLVYSVCTLMPQETSGVVTAFSAAHPEFAMERLELPGVGRSEGDDTAPRGLTLWPQDLGGNGMFVAAWQRRRG